MESTKRELEVMHNHLVRLERKLDDLTFLVRTGGKESRVLERVPAWTAKDCDGECDFTGRPVPKHKLVNVLGIDVHPGVADWAHERGILEFHEEDQPPEDYLVTPYEVRFRKVYRPPTNVVWEPEDLPKILRPGLLFLANHLGMTAALAEQGHEGVEFRSQPNEWVRKAILALRDGKKLPKPVAGPRKVGRPPAVKKKAGKKKAAKKKGKKKTAKKAGQRRK